MKDYEFFIYEEPVKYPTVKDLHIDLDLWEKYEQEHQDDELIDITVAAKEIKEMKKQVSHKGKPENLSEVEQVSGFQHPENAGLSINNLSISNQNKNYDDDAQYLQIRIL